MPKRIYTFYPLLLLFLIYPKPARTQNDICLIPQVETLARMQGTLPIKRIESIRFPDEWRVEGTFVVGNLKELAHLTVSSTTSKPSISVKKVKTEAAEMYTLSITKKGIAIETGDIAGMNHAFATLLQLLLGSNGEELPLLTIRDKPRFGYRGIMIDCSRHFWTIEQLKKLIGQMAFFKLNKLHLHLTDNQGWRLHLDSYPELAVKGTHYRTFEALSGQYYRKSELQDLIGHAALYGIEVIPEVDLPGHCLALLAALPELSCNGGEFEAYPEEMDQKERKRVGENMLCIGNPETYRFVENLVAELVELFPSPLIHLGGDEVSTHIWEQCPKCQAIYKEQKMTSWYELQDYFTKRVSHIVRSKGKRMVGWDEINDRNATHADDVIMIWQRDGKEQQQRALERGLSVIVSPKDPCYFDFGYSRNSTRRLYEWEPAGKAYSSQQLRLIKGGQANVWTEFITTQEELERMLYPRVCALAETLWNSPEKKSWSSFLQRITSFSPVFGQMKIGHFSGEDWDNLGFVPQSEQLPQLLYPARIETNMVGIRYYLPEYVFDGNLHTFFATPYSLEKGDYFTLILERAQLVREIKIIFDLSKEHPKQLKLSVSEDGVIFKEIAAHNANGEAWATLSTSTEVKAIKMELTAPLMARLSIKEFVIR